MLVQQSHSLISPPIIKAIVFWSMSDCLFTVNNCSCLSRHNVLAIFIMKYIDTQYTAPGQPVRLRTVGHLRLLKNLCLTQTEDLIQVQLLAVVVSGRCQTWWLFFFFYRCFQTFDRRLMIFLAYFFLHHKMTWVGPQLSDLWCGSDLWHLLICSHTSVIVC